MIYEIAPEALLDTMPMDLEPTVSSSLQDPEVTEENNGRGEGGADPLLQVLDVTQEAPDGSVISTFQMVSRSAVAYRPRALAAAVGDPDTTYRRTFRACMELKPWENPFCVAAALLSAGSVDYAVPDEIVDFEFESGPEAASVANPSPATTAAATDSWHLRVTGGDTSTLRGILGAQETIIGVLDEGFRLTCGPQPGSTEMIEGKCYRDCVKIHPAFSATLIDPDGDIDCNHEDDEKDGYDDDAYGFHFGFGSGRFSDRGTCRHGNGVAALAVGPRSACPTCRLLALGVRYGSICDLAEAMRYGADRGARVLVGSFSARLRFTTFVDTELAHLRERGVLAFFSSGHCSKTSCKGLAVPSALPHAFAVGASLCAKKTRALFSRFGLQSDGRRTLLLAPSGDGTVERLASDGAEDCGLETAACEDQIETANFNGTSGAAPQVAGLAGLVLSIAPSLTADEVFEILRCTATPLRDGCGEADGDGFTEYCGYGRIDVGKTVDAMRCAGCERSACKPRDVCACVRSSIAAATF